MERIIYTYAYIKALYDQKKDYLDTFWPFCLQVFPQDDLIDIGYVKRKLNEIFELDIPLHVLNTILSRAIDVGYITKTKKSQKFKITEDGIRYLEKIERPEEVERRINELLNDIKIFFGQNSKNLSTSEINSILCSFINKNIEPIIRFLNPTDIVDKVFLGKLTQDENILIKYLELAGKQKPNEYQTLEEMIFGSMISTILYVDTPSELIEYTKRKFENTYVFFDTNYIFSLLNMSSPKDRNNAAIELFQLMKTYGFKFKVFDFTVDELVGVINGYIEQSYRYPMNVNIRSIYSSLKKKGWTNTDARRFISNVENILNELGVQIESTNINLISYKPENESFKDILYKYKDFQEDFNRNHDIAAIENIIKKRDKKYRRIEDVNAFFLSCDTRLSKLNFLEMGHKKDGTICEVILDRFLTTILWLKNPNLKLSLKSIIITYSRDIAIKRRIWEKFYDNLYQLRKSGKINDDDISMLFYHNYIETILTKYDESDLDQISEDFVLDTIENAAKAKEKLNKVELEKEIKEIEKKKEKEFFEKLKEEKKEIETAKKIEWQTKIDDLQKQYRKESDKIAKNIVSFIRLILGVILTIPLIYLGSVGNWNDFLLIIGILDACVIILGLIIGPATKYWKKIKTKISDHFFNKRIISSKLEKLK